MLEVLLAAPVEAASNNRAMCGSSILRFAGGVGGPRETEDTAGPEPPK